HSSTSLLVSHHAAPRALHSFPTRRSSDLVQNNPTTLGDPDGHDIWDVIKGAINAGVSDFAGGAGRYDEGNGDNHTGQAIGDADSDRKSTRLNSSHVAISYAVFCLKKKRRW